jgi:hypothetical protein
MVRHDNAQGGFHAASFFYLIGIGLGKERRGTLQGIQKSKQTRKSLTKFGNDAYCTWPERKTE